MRNPVVGTRTLIVASNVSKGEKAPEYLLTDPDDFGMAVTTRTSRLDLPDGTHLLIGLNKMNGAYVVSECNLAYLTDGMRYASEYAKP